MSEVLGQYVQGVAERFMADKISDSKFLSAIAKNQTPALLKRFEADFGGETVSIRTLRRVALMMPENIHLNADRAYRVLVTRTQGPVVAASARLVGANPPGSAVVHGDLDAGDFRRGGGRPADQIDLGLDQLDCRPRSECGHCTG